MDIRNALDRADLMVFDGNNHEDFIDKMEIQYKENSGYEERLTLNRQRETITYHRKQPDNLKVTSTYFFTDQISKILDNLNPFDFTTTIPGLPKNVVVSSTDLGQFKCKIVRRKLKTIQISGDYEKYSLPAPWNELMKLLHEILDIPATGPLLDEHFYKRRRRCKDDYIYLTVTFEEYGKKYNYLKYNYLTDDDSIMVGDWVLVPVGSNKQTHQVLVIAKNYYKKDQVPYPLHKIKKVVRKIEPDE